MIDLSHINSIYVCLGAMGITFLLCLIMEFKSYLKYKQFYWQEVVYHSIFVFIVTAMVMYLIFPNIK